MIIHYHYGIIKQIHSIMLSQLFHQRDYKHINFNKISFNMREDGIFSEFRS